MTFSPYWCFCSLLRCAFDVVLIYVCFRLSVNGLIVNLQIYRVNAYLVPVISSNAITQEVLAADN